MIRNILKLYITFKNIEWNEGRRNYSRYMYQLKYMILISPGSLLKLMPYIFVDMDILSTFNTEKTKKNAKSYKRLFQICKIV